MKGIQMRNDVVSRIYSANLTTNFRRDLVWRPMIRLFRRWLKKEALSSQLYDEIRSQDIR